MTYQLKDCDNIGLFIACRALGLKTNEANKLIKLERTSSDESLEFEAVIKMIREKDLLKQFDNGKIKKKMTESLKKYPLENQSQWPQIESDKSCIEYFIKKYDTVISQDEYDALQRIKQFLSDNGHKDDSRIFDVEYDRNEYRLGTLNYNENNNISLSILLMALNVNKDKTKELIGKYHNKFNQQTEFKLVITMIKEMKLFDGFTIEKYEDDTLSECLNEYSVTGGLISGQSYSDRDRLDHFLDQYKEPLSRKHLYAFHRIRDFLRANDLKDESAMLNIQIKENDYKIEDLDCTDDNIGLGIVLCALQISLSEAKKLIIEYTKERRHDKANEFLASMKLIKERNLFVCFSKESYESEALNNVIRTHWHKELLTNGSDQQRIKSMISDSTISEAEMYALLRFKELFIKNGHVEESVLLDVKYTCLHIRKICQLVSYSNRDKWISIGIYNEEEDQGNNLEDQGTELEDQGTELEDQGTELEDQGNNLEDQGNNLEDQGNNLEDQGTELKNKENDYIVPFKLLHRVCENVGYNLHSAVHFTKHFVQSYNIQLLEVGKNRGDKNTQINNFLKDNANRGDLVEDMIKQFKQSIREEVLKSMAKDKYRRIIKYQDGIAKLNKLFQIQDEVSDLLELISTG